jgi:hypothetical protein
MFRTSVLASLVLCFHQRCSSKESTRCPKKCKSVQEMQSRCPKKASRAREMQGRCPKKASRARKMQVVVQRNARTPWLIHGSVVGHALERLEAENGQLRGSVVELVLQIRALRGYLAGRLRSG